MFKKLFFVLGVAGVSAAQQNPTAFVGAKLIPINGPEIERGTLVIQAGKILALGPVFSTNIPAASTRIDAAGKVIMRGLVDSHSHIGEPDGGDSSSPIQPDARVLDSINVLDSRVAKARAGGVTTANVMPGSGHLLSGQTLYLKLRRGKTIDDLLIHLADGTIAGGMKMANGTNSRRAPPFPGTRAKSAALVREQYVKAQEYRDKVRAANGDSSKLPARDLNMEGLAAVLDGKKIVQFHTHRHDDIMTALRLSQEFHFSVVLHHASDAWMVADEIKKANVPVSLIMVDSPGGKEETKDLALFTGSVLEKAGIVVGFHTDDPITDSRLLLRSPALAVRAGMSRENALNGVTLANAKIIGLDSRIGSLEAGKDADFVLLSGDPLSVYTDVLETWVEGQKVFDRTEAGDRLHAVGGFGASRESSPQWTDDDGEVLRQ